MSRLFDPIRIGRLTLPNRIILAPLTRGRTGGTGIPAALVAES
jgi:N-ethylmaleimide reductase